MNKTMEAIVIPVGTKYGSFSRIVDIAQHSEHPFRVAVINSVNGPLPLGREEVGEPDKRKKITVKKKSAQETESADQTGPELAPTTACGPHLLTSSLYTLFIYYCMCHCISEQKSF
jgi:hypothetical protein